MGSQTYGHGVSLLDGWLPLTIEIVAIVLLILVVARRSRRWWLLWIPVSVGVGALTVWAAYEYWSSEGMSSDPAPQLLWWWIGALGAAVALLVVGARRTQWWRRVASLLSVIAVLAAAALSVNQWVGYFPTVQEAWAQLTAGPLPDQIDNSTLAADRNTVQTTGKVVSIDTGSAHSDFTHRTEYVYLPPAWFAGPTPPTLPVVMMISGEFNTPADWMRTGHAVQIIDAYARAHHGQAPILVFPDVGGSFNNDTECVNGPRGNVATHLTDEVRPAVISQFHASPAAANWGVVGWSMGGTCAVDLVTMHPDEFTSFEDIAGDAAPNSGTTSQTVSRLFGGSTTAYADFDPATVMARHGRYTGVSGWFDESSGGGWGPGGPGPHGGQHPGQGGRGQGQWGQGHGGQGHGGQGKWGGQGQGGTGLGGRDGGGHITPGSELTAARTLCADGEKVGIACSIHLQSGGHTWQFAEQAFTDALPTMAAEIGVPDAGPVPATATPAPSGTATPAPSSTATPGTPAASVNAMSAPSTPPPA
ncbi:alpha/beta hydrolase-fold protein [Gordonia sp. L191]|uniref:alpha/beta hydrolase n=1 Tax=Gordonia sp. L191 TaxID=2982699 RepID=UPI0024C0624A|nr:alpha/beta hydrolase-fold protein [Gordonia sp. L191]WHU49521.1 alpha/beta hydrolase-fold protein [Gordonia sp. L191]